METAVERIQRMERCFDALQQMAAEDCGQMDEGRLQILRDYYEGGQWLRDYEMDEQGLLPRDLKRGVLSQDELYNFLCGIK